MSDTTHPASVAHARDIRDDDFLTAVATVAARKFGMASRWDIADELRRLLGQDVAERIVLAKAKGLISHGKLSGCTCGCRGDFTVR